MTSSNILYIFYFLNQAHFPLIVCRIDYIFYRMRAGGRVRSVETQEYKTIKEFADTSNGAKISLSDHDWVEASLKINF